MSKRSEENGWGGVVRFDPVPDQSIPLETPMTSEERRALARMPITRGILATNTTGGKSSAGVGECPTLPTYGKNGYRVVGRRARKLSDGTGF